jgi:hypothetical protein
MSQALVAALAALVVTALSITGYAVRALRDGSFDPSSDPIRLVAFAAIGSAVAVVFLAPPGVVLLVAPLFLVAGGSAIVSDGTRVSPRLGWAAVGLGVAGVGMWLIRALAF